MVYNGNVAPNLAGAAVVFTSISSALVNLPLIYQQTHHKALSSAVALTTLGIVVLGLGALAIQWKLLQ